MFTARNAVLLALAQVAVIVVGTLAATVSSKFWETSNINLPFPTFVLMHFGMFLFVLPLVWISAAAFVREKDVISDDLKHLVFLMGMGLLVALIVFELGAIFQPWIGVIKLGFARAPEVE